MSIFNLFNKKTESFIGVPPTPVPDDVKAFVMNYSKVELPTFKEGKVNGEATFIKYGEDNLFPKTLLEFLDESAIHSGIVNGKSYLIAGDDFVIDGVPYTEWKKTADLEEVAKVSAFIENGYNESWYDIKEKLALDWTISGSYALKITWALNFSKIAKVEHLPWQNIRSGEMIEGKVRSYFYADEWKTKGYGSQVEAIEYQAFDIQAHLVDGKLPDHYEDIDEYPYSHEQVLFVKNHFPGYVYYGRPSYIGSLTSVKASGMLSKFYLSSLENGFTPSMIISFKEMPGSKEEGNAVRRQLETQFTAKGVGRKLAVFFSKDANTTPDFQPLDVKNLDQQLLALNEELTSNIIVGHSVTSPELVGVAVSGSLGEASFYDKWSLFKATVIDRDKAYIERTVSGLMSINGINNTITIGERRPF